ncbi:ester cyclase [Mangrovicoccus algicola]|uniref:Ester cyclase n=1 Tax=Mangrovicoccus algicola TaxID=2771008 RepID=A0A8J7CYL2_9RHOB|nr:ester cyclase [Mangrovicoccus algicola]MBE3636673.1 ester cyclase [Mangrovicoccus algicola]
MQDAMRALYSGYIDCLNRQDWARLGQFVGPDVRHDGRDLGLAGYRAMLEADFRAIPDLRFAVVQLVCEPPVIAARLEFDCHPAGRLFGIAVDGRRVRFAENVFYETRDGLIREVWSVIDKAAIAAQL